MVDNNNDEWYTGQNLTGTLTDYSGIARKGKTYDNRAVWSATTDSVGIEHDYFFNDEWSGFGP